MERNSVDEGFVRALVRGRHPDLANLEIRRVASGWDNQLWRLGDELVVRLPMTERAPDLLRKEFRWLPELAGQLPLPVPTPLFLNEPDALFPRPWSLVSWVPGEPADGVEVTDAGRSVANLAEFLRALHRPAPADAPTDPGRGGSLATVTDDFETLLAGVAEAVDVARVRRVWDRAVAAPQWTGPAVWLHADLHPANVVVADGAISGVVDFGDLCAGDPAVDLAAAWKLLPQGSDGDFFDAYGGTDEATVRRARGRAVLKALVLVSVGQAWDRGLPGGQPTWGRAGRQVLERVFASAA